MTCEIKIKTAHGVFRMVGIYPSTMDAVRDAIRRFYTPGASITARKL